MLAVNYKTVENEPKPIKSIPKSIVSKREDDKSLEIRFMVKPVQSILLRTKRDAYIQIR